MQIPWALPHGLQKWHMVSSAFHAAVAALVSRLLDKPPALYVGCTGGALTPMPCSATWKQERQPAGPVDDPLTAHGLRLACGSSVGQRCLRQMCLWDVRYQGWPTCSKCATNAMGSFWTWHVVDWGGTREQNEEQQTGQGKRTSMALGKGQDSTCCTSMKNIDSCWSRCTYLSSGGWTR